MSLVAAYTDSESDDESGNEKVEDSTESNNKTTACNTAEASIEDEDEWENSRTTLADTGTDASGSHLFSQLPQPSASKFNISEEIEDEFVKKKPLTEDSLYLKEKALLEKEKKVEKEKPQETKRSLLSLPKPKKGKNKKQPVKISIPTLNEIGADSDSDDESNIKAKPIISNTENKKVSALFSLLPKPRHSVTVGANKNKVFNRQANRMLMPHTLTKKNEIPKVGSQKNNTKQHSSATTTTVAGNPQTSLVNDESDDEDDDDRDDVTENFFSIKETKPENMNTQKEERDKTLTNDNITNSTIPKQTDTSISGKVSTKMRTMKSNEKNETAGVSTSDNKGNLYFASLFKKTGSQSTVSNKQNDLAKNNNEKAEKLENNKSIQNAVTAPYGGVTRPYGDNTVSDATRPYGNNSYSAVTKPYIDNNVTRPYGGNAYSAVTRHYGENNSVTAPYGDNSIVTAPYNNASSHQQQHGNYSYPTQPPPQQNFFAYEHQAGNLQGSTGDYYNQPNHDTPIEREALTALQGRKRRKEDINLIDIKADDLCGNNDDYLKNLTKESGYSVKKPKNDQPSNMDKRKHQITYLAFQAKEREFELRQSWADSRASKQQTQSRYGF